MSTCKQISIDQARSGLVLAADVNNTQGQCLIVDGTILNTNTIKQLKKYGVKTLLVQDDFTEKNPYDAQKEAISSTIKHQFRKAKDNPEMQQLQQLLLDWHLAEFETQSVDHGGIKS